ncbi:trichohyalin-like [Saccostrea cucullata]|uniref:trichohyalin-like n=1 Tax=Saccostrea cuccullata TaxID=36930 RepID=UPI002ED399FC
MARFRVSYKLNPEFFDISSEDKTKMREFVPKRKVLKTVGNIQSIITHNADVNDFLPPWATEKYFWDLHKYKMEMRESGALNAESEEIKDYMQSIIGRATEILKNENISLKMLEQKPVIDKQVEGESDETVVPKEDLEEYIQSIIEGARKIVKSETAQLKVLEIRKEHKPDTVKQIERKSEETTVSKEELEEYIQSIIEGARQIVKSETAQLKVLEIRKEHKPDTVQQIERKSEETTVSKEELEEYIQSIIEGARKIVKSETAQLKVLEIRKEHKPDTVKQIERKSEETTVCKEELEEYIQSIIEGARQIVKSETAQLKVLEIRKEHKPDTVKQIERKSEETTVSKEELEEYIQSIIEGARQIVKSETAQLKVLEIRKEHKPDTVKQIERKSEETTVSKEELEEYIQSSIEGARQTLKSGITASEVLENKKEHKPDIVKQIERKSDEPTVHKEDLVEYIQSIIESARQIVKTEIAATNVSKIKKEIKADIVKWVEGKSDETVCKEHDVEIKSRTKFRMEEITTYQENLERKQELQAVHENLPRVQSVKKLKEFDDHCVPRRLFLFNIENLKENPKSECPRTSTETCLNTSSVQHSVVESRATEEMVAPKRRTSLRRRILKFLGFK